MQTALPTLVCMKLLLSRVPIYRHLMKHWTTEYRVFDPRRVILLSVCFHESAILSVVDKRRILHFNWLYSCMAEMYPYTDLFFTKPKWICVFKSSFSCTTQGILRSSLHTFFDHRKLLYNVVVLRYLVIHEFVIFEWKLRGVSRK